MNTENQCIFVSSRGILNSCNIKSLNPHSSIPILNNYNLNNTENHKDGTTIYVCTRALRNFIQILLNKIEFRFILVTGDCDDNCYTDVLTDLEFNLFINNPKVIHWFSQNCISTHDKLTKIPIGLDYHTISSNKLPSWGPQMTPLEQEEDLIQLRKIMKPFYERQLTTAYSNFHFQVNTKYGYDRIDAIQSIAKELVYYEPEHTTRTNSWKTQIQHVFVVSPHGGGYDCHRTWEALLLGCIPIVKTSPIDSLFDDLPVLIVKEWRDVTQELLTQTIFSYQKKMHTFNFDKLLLSYWTGVFKSKILH